MKKKKIFISYRRDRADAFAELLYRELKKHYLVFMDKHSIGSGEFSKTLERAIIKSDVFLLVLSEKALHYRKPQDVFRQEIQCALAHKKRIIPLILKDFEYPIDSNGFDKEIQEIQEKEDFKFLDYDYFDVKVEDLRRRLIDQKDNELFFYNGTIAEKETVPKGEKTKARKDNLLYGSIFFILLALMLFLAAGILSFIYFEDLIGGQQETETQGQTVVETAPDTTEHPDSDIVTHESESNNEESTESGTAENEGNTEETIEESTKNEPETEEGDSYRIQSFLIFGKAGTMSINETFLFSGKTNSPIVKLYIIYPEDKWQELKTIIVEDGTFSYEMQGASKWQDATHIAVVPYDGNGIELRENALLREVDFQCENPLYAIRFMQDQYGTEVGRGVNFSWSVPQNVEGNISFELMIVDKEKFEYNIIDPLLDTKDIKGNFCSIKASDMVDIAPGEYMIMLLVRSDKYPNVVVTTYLKVFEN